MNKISSFFIARIFIATMLIMTYQWSMAQALPPALLSGNYHLVWADEFNHSGAPDTAHWGFEQGFVRNEEWQWYQQENAYCKNGLLIIEGRVADIVNPLYQQGSKDWRKSRPRINYTSSCLLTAGKKTWTYGRFVMRAKIGIDKGLWPAWWTLGVSKHWPANGEIDIMEYYNNKVLANIACLGPDKKPEWFSHTIPADSLGAAAWAAAFHTWRMDWTDTAISLYLDDHLMNHTALSKLVNKDGTGFNPFKQPHYMLLNLAIGGTNGGDPSSTSFPARFEVDYVRVYQQRKK